MNRKALLTPMLLALLCLSIIPFASAASKTYSVDTLILDHRHWVVTERSNYTFTVTTGIYNSSALTVSNNYFYVWFVDASDNGIGIYFCYNTTKTWTVKWVGITAGDPAAGLAAPVYLETFAEKPTTVGINNDDSTATFSANGVAVYDTEADDYTGIVEVITEFAGTDEALFNGGLTISESYYSPNAGTIAAAAAVIVLMVPVLLIVAVIGKIKI